LGGVGKTQTAVEYAHRQRAEYTHAFWVTADSREAVGSGYATIVSVLELPEAGAPDQTLAVEAMKCWLSTHENWLLVLDNADDLAMTREFIPSGNSGHVILTTRELATGAIGRRLDIKKMGTDEGALFLLRRSKYILEGAPLDAAAETAQTAAKELAKQLDGLPLALDQAGAYIEETGCGLAGYLDLYRKHAPELLRHRGMLAFDYPESVATTWALSFENIEQANPAAAELLKLCAFLHPDPIPEEVFREGAAELGPVLGAAASDELALNRAIAEILKYSLLHRDPNVKTLEIHRLVQAVLKQGMDEATQRSWAERAVRAVNRTFSRIEFSAWALCERLLDQSLACAALINKWDFEFPEAAQLLNQAASYLFRRGHYGKAEPLYERALEICEKVLGPDHPNVAQTLQNLAGLYASQGRYAEAEPLYQRALAKLEKVLSPDQPDLAQILNNLAGLCQDQGRYAEAEPLYQRALSIREKALKPDHPDLAQSFHNLAGLYALQDRYAEAEPLYRQALL
jgi:tetratricopeptide (TPR) repeat protein